MLTFGWMGGAPPQSKCESEGITHPENYEDFKCRLVHFRARVSLKCNFDALGNELKWIQFAILDNKAISGA